MGELVAGSLNISYDDVQEQIKELHNVAEKIKEISEKTEKISSAISNGSFWSGSSANYYCNSMKDFSKKLYSAFEAIESSSLYIGKSMGGYAKIDQQIINEISNSLNL